MVIALVSALLLPASAGAAPGDLDPSFGNDGVVRTSFSGYAFAEAVTVQEDGRIVVAGNNYGYEDSEAIVTRYLPDGTLDPSFGDGGTAALDLPEGSRIGDVAESHGSLLVAGDTPEQGQAKGDTGSDVLVAQLKENGALDTAFSGSGIVTIDVGHFDGAAGVGVLDDGRIVVGGGMAGRPLKRSFLFARLTAEGARDSTFGTNGVVAVRAPCRGGPTDFALGDDGAAVVVGTGGCGVVKVTASGVPDTEFSSDGRRALVGDGGDSPGGVAMDEAGGVIVTGGTTTTRGGRDDRSILLMRLGSDGRWDKSFGVKGRKGVVRTNIQREDWATGLALQEDGRIVVSGGTSRYLSQDLADFAVLRYRRSGRLDRSFSHDGKAITSLGVDDFAEDLGLAPDETIVVVGSSFQDDEAGDLYYSDQAVARYLGG